MKFRRLHAWKYQLMEPFETYVCFWPPEDIDTEFVSLHKDCTLKLKEHYCWDGASGPCPDVKEVMKGSLVHDALYQLMRINLLDRFYRIYADKELKRICIESGMSKIWANIIYWGVRVFAKKGADNLPEPQIHEIP
jgi:hypothetical protein